MKIKAKKLFAALLAVALVFCSVAVFASADDSDPYIVISSLSNVPVGAGRQSFTVSLSPNTTVKDISFALKYDADILNDVGVAENISEDLFAAKAVDGKVVIEFTGEYTNTSSTDKPICTVQFNFASAGLVELELVDIAAGGTIADKDFGAAFVKGASDADAVYTDLCGVGLKGYISSAGKKSDPVDAKVVVTLNPYTGSELQSVEPIVINVNDYVAAIYGAKVMSSSDVTKLFESEKVQELITGAIQADASNKEKGFSFDDFEIDSSSIKLNGETITSTDKYKLNTEYKYSVTFNQMKKTKARVDVILRPAMDDTDLYHSSNIPTYSFTLDKVNVGGAIYGKDKILSYIKDYIELYTARNGDLDLDGNGVDDMHVHGIYLNQHIKTNTDNQYDLSDFVLDESVVAFNNSTLFDNQKFNDDVNENVYTVYFDQVNVPKTVLMAAAEAFGKLNYGEFARANVVVINQAIGAAKAMVDSLVNADWPKPEDVEVKEDGSSDSVSPATGTVVGLGSTLVIALALGATAAVIIKKKED